jgi:hypothetical protein
MVDWLYGQLSAVSLRVSTVQSGARLATEKGMDELIAGKKEGSGEGTIHDSG